MTKFCITCFSQKAIISVGSLDAISGVYFIFLSIFKFFVRFRVGPSCQPKLCGPANPAGGSPGGGNRLSQVPVLLGQHCPRSLH